MRSLTRYPKEETPWSEAQARTLRSEDIDDSLSMLDSEIWHVIQQPGRAAARHAGRSDPGRRRQPAGRLQGQQPRVGADHRHRQVGTPTQRGVIRHRNLRDVGRGTNVAAATRGPQDCDDLDRKGSPSAASNTTAGPSPAPPGPLGFGLDDGLLERAIGRDRHPLRDGQRWHQGPGTSAARQSARVVAYQLARRRAHPDRDGGSEEAFKSSAWRPRPSSSRCRNWEG